MSKKSRRKKRTLNRPVQSLPKKNKVGRNEWLKWVKAMLIGVIASLMASYLVKYFLEPINSDTFAYYYVLHTIPVNSKNTPETSVNELKDMFSVVIKPDKNLNINHIKIHNVDEVQETSIYYSENDINQNITSKEKKIYNERVGTFTVSNFHTIKAKSTLILNIIGVFDGNKCNPTIVLENNKKLWPIESKLVSQSHLFLSRYWQLVVTLNIMCIISIYYFLRRSER